ncbi:MAG: DoxX family membrane protein [Leptospirales bacterium]|nr:DoxX family membrane protein [Leptospirales bacterium]
MKWIELVLRIIAGLMLLVVGADKLSPFLTHPQSAAGAVAFKGAMAATGYFLPFVGICEMIIGALLLSGQYLRLAALMLAPLVLNFLMYHIMLDPANLPGALFLFVTGAVIAWRRREAFAAMLQRS